MEDQAIPGQVDVVAMAVDVVSAFVSNNSMPAGEMVGLLVNVHAALVSMSAGSATSFSEPEIEKLTPAQIRKSITRDALISFLDGKPYKALKRHVTTHGLTLETYRAKYGLPADYPSVAAGYSASRSALAKSFGLGNQRRKTPEPAPALAAASEKRKRAGRPRKVAEPA